jgi:hypothetical protein
MLRTQIAPGLESSLARTRELDKLECRIQDIHNNRLIQEAELLDVELPTEESAWVPGTNIDFLRSLTPSGRALLRRRIDEEKTRRREVRAWWWKNVVIPALTALTGLAGVITGMIAVIHAKK